VKTSAKYQGDQGKGIGNHTKAAVIVMGMISTGPFDSGQAEEKALLHLHSSF